MPLNTIMLVDDEPRLLTGIRRRLSGDFNIITFERGADAIKHLSNPHDVKVIVADMQMPEMNGIELLKEVRDISPDVRRLMLTGNSDQETAVAAINEGKVFRFIRKPCETEELKAIINQALEDYEFNKVDLDHLVVTTQAPAANVNMQKNLLSVFNDEFRTPLSQIITMSEIINRDIETIDPRTLSFFLTEINKSGKHALRQVDRVLEYTRLQSETIEVAETRHCDIVEIFNKSIASAKAAASVKVVTFTLESIRKKADIIAPHHSSMLMVGEVIQNAVKFSPFGGHVSIILKFNKDLIAARITNSGASSIPEYNTWIKDLSSIPLQALDMSLDRTENGVGLGLSLIHAIAQKYDIGLDFKPMHTGGAAVIMVFKRFKPLSSSEQEKDHSRLYKSDKYLHSNLGEISI